MSANLPLSLPSALKSAVSAGSPPLSALPRGKPVTACANELSGREKAAILVRLLMAEGSDVNLSSLPEAMQTELTSQLAAMNLVDRTTLNKVVQEFVEILEQVGLTFPDGLEGALKLLGGKLSPAATGRLRQLARASGHSDPWERISAAETEQLLDVLENESVEVAAVVLSKIPVARAAEILGALPGPKARSIAFAVSQTEAIAPQVVGRIGSALASELDRKPLPAFPTSSAARVGAILNTAPPVLRDDLLASLDEQDNDFAKVVRRSIFTFEQIHRRIRPLDVTKILRESSQEAVITALAACLPKSDSDFGRSAEFILANISQRMAASLRDEIEGASPPSPQEAEAAIAELVAAVRRLVDAGEMSLLDLEAE